VDASGSNTEGFEFADEDGTVVAYVSDAAAWDAAEDLTRLVPITAVALPADATSPSPAPTEEDLSTGQNLNAAPESEPVSLGGTTDGDVLDLNIAVPAAVASDPDVEYPLVVDHSVSLSPSFDTLVSNKVTVDRSGNAELMIGTFDGPDAPIVCQAAEAT